MHYSRILASVALVAVACAAPVADSSSSRASPSRTPSSSSHTVTVSQSSTSSASHPSVTPPGKSSAFPVATATDVPVPIYYGTTDGGDSTYKFAIEDEPLDTDFEEAPKQFEVPASEKIAEAPFAVEEPADDTTDATAVEANGGYPVDGAFDTAEEAFTEVDGDSAPGVSSKEAAYNYDGEPEVATVQEPNFQSEDSKSIKTGPAVKKHCK